MRANLTIGNFIGDLAAALLRHNAHAGVFDNVAARADDGRQRRNLVGVDDNFTDMSLCGHADCGARRAAHSGCCTRRQAEHQSRHCGDQLTTLEFHGLSPLVRDERFCRHVLAFFSCLVCRRFVATTMRKALRLTAVRERTPFIF